MNLTSSNIKQLVNNCNKNFNVQNIKCILHFDYKTFLNDGNNVLVGKEIAQFTLHNNTESTKNRYAIIKVYSDNKVKIGLETSNHYFDIDLARKVEIEQLIILILPELMLYNNPIELVITQSISGWTNAKVVFNKNNNRACIHTVVIKQAMKAGLINVKNAKLGKNDNIIVDYNGYRTEYKTGPSNLWW